MYDPATGEVMPETDSIVTSSEIGDLAAALSTAQGVIKDAVKDATNPHLNSRYADLGSVWDAIRQPLSTNSLALIQLPVPTTRGTVGLHTRLVHSSGQYIGSTAYIPIAPDKGGNITAQGYGSGLTYLRRYMAMALVGVAPGDDDGIGAMPGTQQQQTQPPRQEQRPQQPVRPILPRPQPITRESLAEKAHASVITPDRQAKADKVKNLIKTCNQIGGDHTPLTLGQVQTWTDEQFAIEIQNLTDEIEELQVGLAGIAAKGQ